MVQNFSLPSGFRDLDAHAVEKRNYLLDITKDVFRRYGFAPIETPAVERLSTLAGAYGEEEEKLIFKILRSGDLPLGEAQQGKDLTPLLCDKALRYDLTVPLARYVQNHQHELTFPFRRYQIQPVWRADRPQKGRYREFLQCDADVVGSHSLFCEVEMLLMIHEVFERLAWRDFVVRINHRNLLEGWHHVICPHWSLMDFSTLLDKTEKMGRAVVQGQLLAATKEGRVSGAGKYVQALFAEDATTTATGFASLDKLSTLLRPSQAAQAGLEAMAYLGTCLRNLGGHPLKISIDPTLARGLSYYTGTIFEVKALHTEIGSVAAGGRYDHLIPHAVAGTMTGLGVSFGIDRLSEVIEVPEANLRQARVLVVYLEGEAAKKSEAVFELQTLCKLREAGIPAELYHGPARMKKQLRYAERKGIPYALIVEASGNAFSLKDLATGAQRRHDWENLIAFLRTD